MKCFSPLFLLILILSSCDSGDVDPVVIPVNPFMKTDAEQSLIIAHRGGRSLFPENTLVAFDGAIQMGVDVLEFDVCLTSDDVLVSIHDVLIDRTCDSSGAVLDYTYEELQAFNFGYHFKAADGSFPFRDDPVRIPRLEQILDQHAASRMIIEIKNPGATGKRAAQILHDLVTEYNMEEKVVIFSFEDAVMQHLRSINTSDLYIGGSISDAIAFVLAAIDYNEEHFRREVDVFSFPTELEGIELDLITSSERIIEAANNRGIAIYYWTINEEDMMINLIEKEVDGIITDKPDIMQEVLIDLGG